MAAELGDPRATWHEDEILEAWRQDYGGEPDAGDYDMWQDEIECMHEAVTAAMKEVNPEGRQWFARVENFGWQSLNGHTGPFTAETGQQLLQRLLPETQNRFEVYVVDTGNNGVKEIRIHNAHHDKPTGGEWYYAAPYVVENEDD